jgi:hypothetical protein
MVPDLNKNGQQKSAAKCLQSRSPIRITPVPYSGDIDNSHGVINCVKHAPVADADADADAPIILAPGKLDAARRSRIFREFLDSPKNSARNRWIKTLEFSFRGSRKGDAILRHWL